MPGRVAAEVLYPRRQLHDADSLNTSRDNAFRLSYAKAFKLQPDVYAVQGYDAAQLLGAGLAAVKGDISKRNDMVAAMEKTKIDSPRGPFTLGKTHNPVQHIYCARWKARRTRWSASRSSRSPIRAAAAGCEER